MKSFLFWVTAFFLPLFVFAQVTLPALPPVQDVGTIDFITALIQSLGGLKGAGALGIAGVVVQLLMKFLGTSWAEKLSSDPVKSNQIKLVLVGVLSVATTVIGLMSGGVALGAALLHGTTLTAFMVLLNQVYKAFVEQKA